jgi:signal transduction histidine kinase
MQYSSIMSQSPTSPRENRLLLLAGFLAIGSTAGMNYMNMPGRHKELVAGLLLVFGILLARTPQQQAPNWQYHFYLAAQTSLIVGLFVLGGRLAVFFVMLFFILSAQASELFFPQRTGALWIILFILITAGALSYFVGISEGLPQLPLYVGGYTFFGIFANAMMRADAAQHESQALLAELQEAHRQLQAYAEQVEEMAVVEERNRLAREMHDTLGHRLTVASVQLEGAQRLVPSDPERASNMVGTVRDQVREALGELRHTVATLRAPVEADLRLRSALRRLTADFKDATALTMHQILPEDMPPLPVAHRQALYRAAQEALTNIQRHANANQVWLVLTVSEGTASLLVSDDGVGFPPDAAAGAGFGLRGLRERAAQLDGELYLEPRAGGGAQLSFRLPLPRR